MAILKWLLIGLTVTAAGTLCSAETVEYIGPGEIGGPYEGYYEIVAKDGQGGCCRTFDGDSSAVAIKVYSAEDGTWEPKFHGTPGGIGLRECIRRCSVLTGCVGVEIGASGSERCELYLESERPVAISNEGKGCVASKTGCYFREIGGAWDDENWIPPNSTVTTPTTTTAVATAITVTTTASSLKVTIATTVTTTASSSEVTTAADTTTMTRTSTASTSLSAPDETTTVTTVSATLLTNTDEATTFDFRSPNTISTPESESQSTSISTTIPAVGTRSSLISTTPTTVPITSPVSTTATMTTPSTSTFIVPTEGEEPIVESHPPLWWPPVLAVGIVIIVIALYIRRRRRKPWQNRHLSVYDDAIMIEHSGDVMTPAESSSVRSGIVLGTNEDILRWPILNGDTRRNSYVTIAAAGGCEPQHLLPTHVKFHRHSVGGFQQGTLL